MQNSFNDIWEAMLKTAVVENSYNKIKDYLPLEDINKLELPRHYDAKMIQVIRHYQNKIKFRKFIKYFCKVASLLLVVVGIAFIILLQFDEVRASCKSVVTEIYERFIQYDFKELDGNEEGFDIGYVPEGYHLEITELNGDGKNLVYINDLGNQIEIAFFKKNRTINIDNEQYQISRIQVDDVFGEFYEAQLCGFENYIIWSNKKGYFYIASSLDKDTMKKIAENIK